ncbi:hypothetical protein N7493_007807 [Penicillium malachiteum]|uniref:Uncharacterized protein n=1 Tax=Penicillium malachiteum TaxID=1324776 RepID=A0AAD6MUB4_9EURO|nr:hypothetical protein N7493_007807 [Penicillium malachiteum]
MDGKKKGEPEEDKVFDKPLEDTEDAGDKTREASFFVTAAGFLGVGPADLKPDDKIVLFYGSRYPIALRRSLSQRSKWHFVGFVYVHGVMEGELWDCFPDMELTETEFWLE